MVTPQYLDYQDPLCVQYMLLVVHNPYRYFDISQPLLDLPRLIFDGMVRVMNMISQCRQMEYIVHSG